MGIGKIIRLLNSWIKAGFITDEQARKITEHLKASRRQQFLRLIKVLFVLGALWLVIGFVAVVMKIDAKVLLYIWNFICNLFSPVVNLAKWIAGERYGTFLVGIGCILGWGLFHYLGKRLQARSMQELVRLGSLSDPALRLGTSAFTIGYILAAVAFQSFNGLSSIEHSYYDSQVGSIPYFSFLAVIFFLYIAYRMKDQIALLFGIGFLGHAVGFLTAYSAACYMIAVSLPGVQALVGVLLIFVGLWHVEKVRENEDSYFYLFGRTYQWTGLLFIFFSLWIMSIWGITIDYDHWRGPSAFELWVSNLLFLGASLSVLFYGAWKEDRMYFNYGITFLAIDTYTLFFSHVWSTVGSAVGSLLFGVLLIGTGYFLRRLFLTKKIG